MTADLATVSSAVGAAFIASIVEIVEAFTIILAVATIRGWRPALSGTVAGLALLAILVVAGGSALRNIPLYLLQVVIGVLLLLFGLRWLRKAILRYAGYIALHDEQKAFDAERAELSANARHGTRRLEWLAAIAAFKAVVLEGLEVVFIVIAVGAGHNLIVPAALGAAAACGLVLIAGILVRRPLARVPENTLKFVVGIMLSAFGTFWTGEGLGVDWPGSELALPALIGGYLLLALLLVGGMRSQTKGVTS